MTAGTLLVGLGVIVAGLLVGEVIYRRRASSARLFGDFSQAVYATFMLIIVIAAAFGGGYYTFVAFFAIILYFATARTKWGDVRSTNFRAALNGQDK